MSRVERHVDGRRLIMDGYTIYYTDGAKFMTWASDIAHAKRNSHETNPEREIARITRTYDDSATATTHREPAERGKIWGEPIWAKEENYLYDLGEVAAIMNITEYGVEKLIHTKKLEVAKVEKAKGKGKPERYFTRQQIEAAMRAEGALQ